jgi:hypothetical protein
MVPENKQNRRYKQINFFGLQNKKLYERFQPCVVKDDDYFEGQ